MLTEVCLPPWYPLISIALEIMPLENKKDYVEAARLLPNLIKTESNPVKFLRSQDFNPWAAARSLVSYWKYRRHLFKDRWLLHMDDSGAGALDHNDIDLLRSGWLAFVANPPTLLIDHGKFRGHSPDSQCRVLFYLGATAPNEEAQAKGMVAIRLISTETPHGEPAPTRRQFEAARLGWKFLNEALPVKLNQAVLLKIGARDKGNMINFFINRVGKALFEMMQGITPAVVSLENSMEAAKRLAEFGIQPEALPPSHGGTWSYNRLFDWKTEDRQDNFSVQLTFTSRLSSAEYEGSQSLTAGALYAKRSYRKRKQMLQDLEDDVSNLRSQKVRLERDNERLQTLFRRAIEITNLQEQACPQLPEIPVEDFDDFDSL